MSTRDEAAVSDAKGLSEILHVGFSQRRKMIRRTVLPWLMARGVSIDAIDGTLRPSRSRRIPGISGLMLWHRNKLLQTLEASLMRACLAPECFGHFAQHCLGPLILRQDAVNRAPERRAVIQLC